MTYTQRRLKETLRVFRRAQAAERRQQERDCLHFDRSLRNKHAFRLHEQQTSGPQATRWQRENSDDDEDDDDYDPSCKRQSKKHAERAVRSKRKAPDTGDEAKEKKKAKTLTLPRASTAEELRSKVSFLTFKLPSEKCKELKELSDRHNTGLRNSKASGSKRILGDASKDTWAWEMGQRKTYEEHFSEQSGGIDNNGGRALRNRKVPAIEIGLKKANPRCQDGEEAGCEGVQMLAEQEQRKLYRPASILCGLPSPAATPPESKFPSTQNHCRQKTPPKDIITISPSPSPTPECRPERIQTQWAHPIDFQYTFQPGEPPCHFCSDFRYGLTGFPRRRVSVKRTGTANKMYDELGNGHRNNNKEATRMCVKCALSRIYISNCAKHATQVLPGIDPLKPELPNELYRPYTKQIVNGKGIEDNKPVHPVCSLCLSPALFRCCTSQAKDMMGRVAMPTENMKGCGLLLCEDCEQMLHQHQGVLKRHFVRAAVYEVNVKRKERPMRADHEFLFRGSLLHQAYGRM